MSKLAAAEATAVLSRLLLPAAEAFVELTKQCVLQQRAGVALFLLSQPM